MSLRSWSLEPQQSHVRYQSFSLRPWNWRCDPRRLNSQMKGEPSTCPPSRRLVSRGKKSCAYPKVREKTMVFGVGEESFSSSSGLGLGFSYEGKRFIGLKNMCFDGSQRLTPTCSSLGNSDLSLTLGRMASMLWSQQKILSDNPSVRRTPMHFIPPKSSLSTEVNRLNPEHIIGTIFQGGVRGLFSLSLWSSLIGGSRESER